MTRIFKGGLLKRFWGTESIRASEPLQRALWPFERPWAHFSLVLAAPACHGICNPHP